MAALRSSALHCCVLKQLPGLPGRRALTAMLRRREDDGTFVVMMQSVEHQNAPAREPAFYNWRAPIRAQVSRAWHDCFPVIMYRVSWLHAQ